MWPSASKLSHTGVHRYSIDTVYVVSNCRNTWKCVDLTTCNVCKSSARWSPSLWVLKFFHYSFQLFPVTDFKVSFRYYWACHSSKQTNHPVGNHRSTLLHGGGFMQIENMLSAEQCTPVFSAMSEHTFHSFPVIWRSEVNGSYTAAHSGFTQLGTQRWTV